MNSSKGCVLTNATFAKAFLKLSMLSTFVMRVVTLVTRRTKKNERILVVTIPMMSKPAKTSVSPRSSPLGTFPPRETFPAPKSEERRMFSQATDVAISFKTRQGKTRQFFIWSLIQSYVHRLYPNNLNLSYSFIVINIDTQNIFYYVNGEKENLMGICFSKHYLI